MINIIVAVDKKYGIAKNGKLPLALGRKSRSDCMSAFPKTRPSACRGGIPWHIKEDLRYFSKVTRRTEDPHKVNAVIMGRKTWQSLPRALKNRVNIVLSNTLNVDELYDYELYDDNVSNEVCILAKSLDNAVQICNENDDIENIFVIGGMGVYKEVLDRNLVNKIYMTRIDEDYECDTFFPEESFERYMMVHKCRVKKEIVMINNVLQVTYCEYDIELERKNDLEYQYLNLLRIILKYGDRRQTRNAETLSIFGPKMLKFDLAKGFPLLTTKKTWWRAIVLELLWILRGDTNAKHLSDKKVKIWNSNTTREFLDSVGLSHYKKYDIGAIYGYQLRYAGSKYKGMDFCYTGKGFDQLRYIINLLKNDPKSRRIIMSTFCAYDSGTNKGCLYPCHGIVIQFYVRDDKWLDCMMFQRSCDAICGLPFNIASYALLVHIIGKVVDLTAGKLTMVLGDTHIYFDHIEAAKTQIERNPYKFSQIKLLKDIDPKSDIETILKYIENLQYKDFKLINYKHHPAIKIKMVA